jgi:hypothetical protein
LLIEPVGREAVETSERYADRLVSSQAVSSVRKRLTSVWQVLNHKQPEAFETSRQAGEEGTVLLMAVDAAQASVAKGPFTAASSACVVAAHTMGHQAAILEAPATFDNPDIYVEAELRGRNTQYLIECHLLRDIFGDDIQRSVPASASMTANITSIAQGIYSDRAFDHLPILADALEEAGCTDAEILAHCRSEGPHVRGCWVVDLILGKE